MMMVVDEVLSEMQESLVVGMAAALLATVVDAGEAAAATAKTAGELTTAQVVLAFDVADTAAAAFAEAHALELSTTLTVESRAALSELIAAGFLEGIPPKALAADIGPLVGLTTRDAAFVAKAKLSSSAKRKLVSKLLRRRGTVIARTEGIRAANEGQRIFWQQAVRDGLLTGLELREWIVTPDDRLCEICEPMAGQRVGLNDTFETGDGDLVTGPPAHPSCRCAVGLTNADLQN